MRQVRLPMADFFIDCYFNGFCKGRKNFFLLHDMQHSLELQLRAMTHSTELRLFVMLHSAQF
jgi:hypothetical protein